MKNQVNRLIRTAGATVTVILIGMSVALSQEPGTARGGGAKLIGKNTQAISTASVLKSHPCDKCVTEMVQIRDSTSKGGAAALATGAPLNRTVAKHGCNDCKTEWKVVGHGKAKAALAAHKCSALATDAAECCKTAKR